MAKKVKTKAPPALDVEIALSGTALIGQMNQYNPDNLVQSKAKGIQIYQEMVRDPYVKAALQMKKSAILSMPWTVQPASSEAPDIQAAEFLTTAFGRMEHSMSHFIEGALDALDCGYSIHEKVHDLIETGPFAGRYGLSRLAAKDPYWYEFNLDNFSRVESIVSRAGLHQPLPPDKFFIFTYQPRYENPYGMSDLRAAYRAFFLKDIIWRFRALYLERFGMPPIYGKFPPGTSDEKKAKILKVLRTMQTETAMAIPNDIEIKALELATLGKQTEYERAMMDLNKEILIGILGSFLQVEEGKKVGSRASSQEAGKVTELFINRTATVLGEEINRQLGWPLVDMNFNVEEMPTFSFDAEDEDELAGNLETDRILKNDMKLPLSNEYLYRKYRRPVPGGGETVTAELGDSATFIRYVERRRAKAMREAGNGDIASIKKAWREILDYCEARDNANYPTKLANEMAKWETLSEEKLGTRPTSDEAVARLESALEVVEG